MIQDFLKTIGLGRFLPNSFNWITVNSANKLIENNQTILIDVRSEFEWIATGLPFGSHGIELQNPDFVSKVSKLCNHDKSNQITLTCLSGQRSKKAARWLMNAGFENLVCVEGGIVKWQEQNLPIQEVTTQ